MTAIRMRVRLLCAACLLFVTGTALADQGMVIWQNRACGFFVLQMKSGYGLFEWISGPQPNDGDVIEGDLSVPGEYRVNFGTGDLPTLIFLQETVADRAAIAARTPEKCRSPKG